MNEHPMEVPYECKCCGNVTKHHVTFIKYEGHKVSFNLLCKICVREAYKLGIDLVSGHKITLDAKDWLELLSDNKEN